MKAYTLMVLFATQSLLCGIGYSSENQYDKDITVRLEKIGETVQGEPIVVTTDQASDLYWKDVHLITINDAGSDVWECQLKKGESYVIGWRAAKGWFKKKLIGYCSEPFTANEDGQRVSFSPGLPATFEYDLSKLPKYVKKFPAEVRLRKIGVNGDHDFISYLSVMAKRPGIVRIKGLAGGKYYLEATNMFKMTHRHEPFLYDIRRIRIETGKRCRFDPIIPALDTTVDPGDVTIRGKVVDISGKPLVNRDVILMVRGKDGVYQRDLFYEIIKTNSSGGFVFKGVIPNRRVSVHCSGEGRLLTKNSLPEHADVSVNIVVGCKRVKCLPGEAFLPLVLIDKDGKTIRTEVFKGKIVVYDFWATWCGPCLGNMPKINALAEEIGSDDVLFMTLSQDTDINVWKKKLADEKWNALSHGFLDITKNESEYEMPGIPFYVVVDKNGIIQAVGDMDIRDEIENIVRINDKPTAIRPQPADGALVAFFAEVELSWMPGAYVNEHKVYFGTAIDQLSPLAEVIDSCSVTAPALEKATTYYWRVDEVQRDGSIAAGDIWSFNTGKLVGLWKMDGDAVDSSGNGNHGTIIGEPNLVIGKVGGALQFDGIDDSVRTDYAVDLPTWTVALWLNSPVAPSSASPAGPVHRESNYQINWDHSSEDFQGAAGLQVGNNWYTASFGELEANTWYHLAATYDGENLRSYKNGILITDNPDPSGLPKKESATLKFARHANYGDHFKGTIDDVCLYSYDLSADEVAALYEDSLAASASISEILFTLHEIRIRYILKPFLSCQMLIVN